MMPRLEDLPLWVRVAIALAAVAVAILLLLFAHVVDPSAAAQSPTVSEPDPSQYDAHLIAMDKVALEEAYHDQIKLLFSVWLKDDISTTHRVTNGARIARRAYIHAAGELEKREKRRRERISP
jgi:hypothetical protein